MSTPWGIDFEITDEMLHEVKAGQQAEHACLCASAPPDIHAVFHVVKNALIECYGGDDGAEYAEVACGASNALAEFILHLVPNRSEAEIVKQRFMDAIKVTFERVIQHMEDRGDFDEGKSVDECAAESE